MRIEVVTEGAQQLVTVKKRRGRSNLVPVGSCPAARKGDSSSKASLVAFLDAQQKAAPGEKFSVKVEEVNPS